MKKNQTLSQKQLPDEVMDLIAGGRNLNPDEVAYLSGYIPSLQNLGLLDQKEKDNINAYLLCIDALKDGSPSFPYDYKVNYQNVYRKLCGQS